MSGPRRASSGSYAPVFINPSQPADPGPAASGATVPRAPPIRLLYPWPLLLCAACDLSLTWLHARKGDVGPDVIAVCLGRSAVLGLVCGLSRQWRSRGGWVAVGSVTSVGVAVWTVCKSQLEGGKRAGDEEGQGVPIVFLVITALLAMSEYILFLLLLRLSPPPHRAHPLALRSPRYALQCPTAFAFDARSVPDHEPVSPTAGTSATARRGHLRQSSRHALLRPGTPLCAADAAAEDEDEGYEYGDEGYEYEDDGYDPESGAYGDSSDTSSISDSSIIDLPPPLAPAPIAPAANAGGAHGLDILAAMDGSPVFGAVGAVVRRTKSARFLGRSWGSRRGDSDVDGPAGYGTFGGDRGDRGDRSDRSG